MANSMVHWNGCQMCVIDTETTGLDPYIHEAIQVAIVALDSNLDPRPDVMPFYLELKPEHPERVDKKALSINKLNFGKIVRRGIDRINAVELLESWMKKLELPVSPSGRPKTVIPLGHNYAFDKGFMIQWLGREQYDEFFHWHDRCSMRAAIYLNDLAAMQGEKPPFSKVNLAWLCKALDVPHGRAHDALQDCLATAQVYKKLLTRFAVI